MRIWQGVHQQEDTGQLRLPKDVLRYAAEVTPKGSLKLGHQMSKDVERVTSRPTCASLRTDWQRWWKNPVSRLGMAAGPPVRGMRGAEIMQRLIERWHSSPLPFG